MQGLFPKLPPLQKRQWNGESRGRMTKERNRNKTETGGGLERKTGEWGKTTGTMQIKRLKSNQSINHVISAAEQKPPLAMS